MKKKILVTGAGGYIGARLIPRLLHEGYEVYALVRSKARFSLPEDIREKVHVLEGNLLDPASLDCIPETIDAAYYLVHSMAQNSRDFDTLEKECAENFVNRMNQTKVEQIIYLGGLINQENLSKHLASRLEVEKVLKRGKASCTILRAGIIIGSGSASFEIIRDLVEKLPMMVAPKWVANRVQPIAIYDVLHYLKSVLFHRSAYDQTFDIGGPDILTYKEMLYIFAEERHLKRLIITVPVLTPRLSSYWLYLVTSVNFELASSLVDSLKNDAVMTSDAIHKVIPHETLSYRAALKRTFQKIEQNEVVSSWKDAIISSGFDSDLSKYMEVPKHGCLSSLREVPFKGSKESVIDAVFRIGGKTGWYYLNFAWTLRGLLDKLAGGVGLRRGRTHETEIHSGDALDFWRVIVADREEGRLLLYAEMRLPGEAWLSFEVKESTLIQLATFRPKGALGRLYWYLLLPVHEIIFRGMAKKIASFGSCKT